MKTHKKYTPEELTARIDAGKDVIHNPDKHGMETCWKHGVPIVFQSLTRKPECPACNHIFRLFSVLEKADADKKMVFSEMKALRTYSRHPIRATMTVTTNDERIKEKIDELNRES